MKAKVTFSHITGAIVLEYVTENGEYRQQFFTRTSHLLNYCHSRGIVVALEDCITI